MSFRNDACRKMVFENLEELKTPYCEQMIKSGLLQCVYERRESVWSRMVDASLGLIGQRDRIVAGLGVSLAGVVMMVFVAGVPGNEEQVSAPQAQAMEIVGGMQRRLAMMPVRKAEEIESLIEADLGTCIQEALAADDLRVLSRDELVAMLGDTSEPVAMPWASGNEVGVVLTSSSEMVSNLVREPEVVVNPRLVPGDLVYLYHTDSMGRKVVLGVTEERLPIVRLVAE